MKITRLNLLAGSILAASSLLPLVYIQAEDKQYEMPADAAFDPNPAAPDSPTNKLLVYGKDKKGITVPLKTIRITNNSDKMLYPVMRDPNAAATAKGGTEGLYDPYDKVNEEHRGYIGYKEEDTENRGQYKYYFGLKPGQSILVQIPLVFWNGARMGLGTDGQFLTVAPADNPDGDVLQNPLRYRNKGKRTIADAEIDTDPRTKNDTITNGVVMWYHGLIGQAPNDDTEDQLIEWSIRDNGYLKTVNDKVPDTELVQLINYDVSNVDNLYLPVAMQVLDAWVEPQKTDDKAGTLVNPNRNGGWSPGSMPRSNGWTGSIDKIEDLQNEIRKFTATPNEYLGEYFGKQRYGWPYYNMPGLDTDDKMPVKIPSGANIFAQSPFRNTRSSYGDGVNFELDRYMLSSGGTDAIMTAVSSIADGDSAIILSSSEPEKKRNFLKPGMVVSSSPNDIFAPGTTISEIKEATHDNKKTLKVILSKKMVRPVTNLTAEFSRPQNDYAADAMIRLWYSWAEYYRANWKKNNPHAPTTEVEIEGSIDQVSATIEFAEKQEGLVPGMTVDGPGLKDAMCEEGMHQGKAVILEVAGDKKSVILSQVARDGHKNVKFKFAPPAKLMWTPKENEPGGKPLKFDLPEKGQAGYEAARDPYLFAQKVYLIMASMNQIDSKNNDSICKFMQDVVGANMGYIFDAPAKASDDGKMVTSMIRDMIKSVLRGVVDFTEFPDLLDNNNKHLVWYPDPAKKTGGQHFNVFNLDPFVWFVHVKLGFSGYGFSVDDDTADIGAGGATRLQVSVAGPKGLANLNEWSIQAPFGPLKGVNLRYSGTKDKVFAPGTIKEVTRTADDNVKISSVGASNMRDGDLVFIDQVPNMPAINEKTFVVRHAKKESFEIVDQTSGKAIPFSGEYTGQKIGRFGAPMQPYIETGSDLTKVFHLVQDDDALRTFQGTLVTVYPGGAAVDKNKEGIKFRVQRKGDTGKGILILNTPLTNKDGTELSEGYYNFDFVGSSSKAKTK